MRPSARTRARRFSSPRRPLWVLAVGVAALAGCSTGSSDHASIHNAASALPSVGQPGTKLLYNRFDGKLVEYSLDTKKVVDQGNRAGYSQYAFQPVTELYSSGDQAGRDFSLLRVVGNEVETVLRPGGVGAAGIFPLAASGSTVFIDLDHGKGGATQHLVASRFNRDHSLTAFPHVKGAQGGAIVGGDLYFTTYRTAADSYNLYRTPISSPGATPKLVETGLESETLYAHGGALYRYVKGKVVGAKTSYRCASDDLCEFHDEANLFVEIATDADSGLALTATDTRTGKTVAKASDVVDYRIRDGKLVVYCDGSIKTFPLRSS